MLRFAAGRPTQSTSIDDVTVEIAVPSRGTSGSASTNAVDERSLAECAERARLAARAAAAPARAVFPASRPSTSPRDRSAFDPVTAELDPAAGRRGAGRSVRVGRRARPRGARHLDRGRAGAGGGQPARAAGAERRTDAFMKVICIAPERAERVRVGDRLHGRRDPGPRAGRAGRGEGRGGRRAGSSSPPGEYPVVFEPQAVGWLWTCSRGARSTAWRTPRAAARSTGRLGEQVAAPAHQHRRLARAHPRTLPRSFDAEGSPRRRSR